MHHVIRLIVRADSVTDAKEKAMETFEEEIITDTNLLDYAKPMESGRRGAGSNRYTKYKDEPAAFPMDSERGSREMQDAFEETRTAFVRNVCALFEAVSEADNIDEMMRAQKVRLYAKSLYMRPGADYKLYFYNEQEGDHIYTVCTEYNYSKVTDIIESTDLTYYIVPLDAHS